MRKLRAVVLFCLVGVLLLQSGCWDAHELDTLSIVSGVGVDPAEDDGYEVTVQIRKVSKNTESEPEQPFTLFSGIGTTVLEGMEQIRRQNFRELFLHQNQVIVISQEQAEKGIRPLLDMFLRFHETRLDVWVLISSCTAKELFQVKLNQEPVTATALALMMQDLSDKADKLSVNMLNVTSAMIDTPSALVVPMVDRFHDNDEDMLKLDRSAVFINDKMVGVLSEDETLGYAIATSSMQSGVLEVKTEMGEAVLYISNSFVKLKTRMEDGHMAADISVESKLSIAEIKGFEGQKLPEVFTILEEAAVKRMVELVTQAFEASRAHKADIFALGAALRRSDPKAWDRIKEDWVDLYPQTTLSVTAKGNLLESGKISDSLTMKEGQ